MKILKKIGAGILFIILAVGIGAFLGEATVDDWYSGALFVSVIIGGVIAVIAFLAAVIGCYLLLKYIFEKD